MLNFNFPEKDLRLVSPPHFVYDFSRMFLMLYSINSDQILLFDYLYFSTYWAICILQLFVNLAVRS